MIFKLKIKKNRGFTLVEMLVAVGLFVVIATFSLGSVLMIFDANRKAQSSKTVVDNLNLSLENMARTVRFGSSYYCGAISSDPNSVNDCSGGNSLISVTANDGVTRVIFKLNGTAIQRSDAGAPFVNITSSDTSIDYLNFYVFNTGFYDNKQPYVIAVIKGHVGTKSTSKTDFSIQTVMSQRKIDYHP